MSTLRPTPNPADAMAWASYGNCVGVDPDIFFPERGDDTSRARALCRDCPVRQQCLDWAIDSRQRFGIWGGMTPSQRRRLRRHPKLVLVATDPTEAAGTAGTDTIDSADRAHVRHLHLVE